MKRYYITTVMICLLVLLAGSFAYGIWDRAPVLDHLKVGFIYENDESTPYTYNFFLAEQALKKEYGDRVEIVSRSNVRETETEEPLRELVDRWKRLPRIIPPSSSARCLSGPYPATGRLKTTTPSRAKPIRAVMSAASWRA